jgi:hypothetical protein
MLIEMFQCWAARIVTNRQRNTSSVGDWCSSQDKRKDVRPVMKYKIANKNVDISKQDRLKPSLLLHNMNSFEPFSNIPGHVVIF